MTESSNYRPVMGLEESGETGYKPTSRPKVKSGKDLEKSGYKKSERDTQGYTYKALLEAFLDEIRASGGSSQAIGSYRARVPHFLDYLEETGQSLDIYSARGYMEYLAEKGTRTGASYKNNTLASYRQAVGRFSRWMRDSGHSMSDPFTAVRPVRGEKIIPRNLPDEKDLVRLLEHLEDYNTLPGLKQRKRRYLTHVMTELLYASGLRISEAADLREEDLDLDRKSVYVRCGKGSLERTAYLNDYSASILREYLMVRDHILTGKSNRSMLFGASHFELGKAFNRDLKEVCSEVGIYELTAHSLRHCLGYHLLRSGAPLRQIQQILGHRNIGNTEIYTKVDVKEVKEQLDRYHPRGRRCGE